MGELVLCLIQLYETLNKIENKGKKKGKNKGKNKGDNNAYRFNISDVVAYFGKPDYMKTIKTDDKKLDQYAYLFDYQATKDWACIITYDSGEVKSIVYSKTIAHIMNGWREYE